MTKISNQNLTELAHNLRKNMTPWERKLWYQFLRNYPVRIHRQKTIANYIVDFYCASAKLIIELDGGGHYIPEQIEKDIKRTECLQKMGFSVLRFCNLDIDNNFYGVCTKIDEIIKSKASPHPAFSHLLPKEKASKFAETQKPSHWGEG